jgi:intracellular sulfur oxidation DsrE/DsrF family protein
LALNRRKFVTSVAALGAASLTPAATQAQLIYGHGDWNFAEFDKLLRSPARAKQVFDIRDIGSGKFLNNVKNSLNAFHYGFGVPNDQIAIAVALHGPANTLAFDDSMWTKYRLGEFTSFDDPTTSKPAVRNVYFAQKPVTSTDPQDRSSSLQDFSIHALQARGVKFLSCHTATEEQAAAIVKKFSLTTPIEEVVKDLQAHVLPGVLIVPGMTASISMLQSEGKYTYITV